MGIRRSALVAVLLFAVLVAGVAFAASRAGRQALEPLPSLAAAGAETALLAPGDAGRAALSYTVKGKLPALDGEAPAYRLPATTTAARVRDLARALKVDGEVHEDEAGWRISTGDATLSVARLPGLPWHLSAGCPDSPVRSDGPAVTACAQAVPGVVEPARSGGMSAGATPGGAGGVPPCKPCPPGETCTAICDRGAPEPAPAPPPDGREPAPPAISPPRPVDLPPRDEAERIARDTLERLGVAVAGLRLEGGDWGWQAAVDLRVDGHEVRGWQTSLLLGSAGRIVGASGQLAEPDRIGEYPLAGTSVGLERLRQVAAVPQPLGGTGGGQPQGCGAAPCEIAPADPGSCPPGTCMDLPAPEPAALVIVDARLALEAAGDKLVPVYVFELDGQGDGPSVPAVIDRWLERRPPEAEPRPQPRPEPGIAPSERLPAEWRLVDPNDRDAVLELRYVHGGCVSLDGVEVDERADQVTVTVFNVHSGAEICTKELRVGVAQAQLRSPLGDRRLLGACRPGEGACDVLDGPAS